MEGIETAISLFDVKWDKDVTVETLYVHLVTHLVAEMHCKDAVNSELNDKLVKEHQNSVKLKKIALTLKKKLEEEQAKVAELKKAAQEPDWEQFDEGDEITVLP